MLPDGGKDMLNVVKGKSRAIEKAERKENSFIFILKLEFIE